MAALLHIDISLTEGSFAIQDLTSRAAQTHMSGRCSAVWIKERPDQASQVLSAAKHSLTKDQRPVFLASVNDHLQQQAHNHTECIANMFLATQTRTDGHCCHPAIMDGCLHLATSFLRPHSKRASLAVPVGMRSMVAEHVESLWCKQSFSASCRMMSLADEQKSYESNHLVLGPSQTTCAPAASIAGLQARAAEHMMDTLGSVSAKQRKFVLVQGERQGAPVQQEPLMLYHIVWEAACMAGQSSGKSERRPQADAILAAASFSSSVAAQVVSIPTKGRDAALPLGQLLNHFQQIAVKKVMPDFKVSISTTGVVLPSRCLLAANGSSASAGSWGMLRVAASEVSNAKWGIVDRDYASGMGHSMTDATDVYGSVQSHNVALQPMLYPVRRHTSQRSSHRLALPSGTVLVTGGLGGRCHDHARTTCESAVGDVLTLTPDELW
jgi:hypothetical protein